MGKLSLSGATGSILERSLHALEKLISSSFEEVGSTKHTRLALSAFSLSEFIDKVFAETTLSAKDHGCTLRIQHADAGLNADYCSTISIADCIKYF